MLVVADGVGGWINQGIDSGLFSKALVWDINRIHYENPKKSLKDILIQSVKINVQTGSATCVIAAFDDTKSDFITTTNLGDSGYVIYRPDESGKLEKIFRS